MKKNQLSMTEGPLFGGIVLYTIPIILTSLLQLLFNAADLIVVGWFRGPLYVGAVGSTGAITNLIVTLFIGLSVGVGVTVAHAYGQKDWTAARRTVHTAIPVAILSGSILTIVGMLFSEQLLVLMNTPEEQLPYAAIYMKIYFGGIIFNMLYNFAASILRAVGDTKTPLIYLSIAGVINVILNVIFIYFFNMDVDGVALATTISQAISAILVLRVLMKRTDAVKFSLWKMNIYGEQLKKIVAIGLPSGLNSALFSISNVMIQSSVNSFGDPSIVSGNAAAANIEGFVWVSLNAFHQTAVNYTGQNMGAGNFKRVKKTLWLCLGCVSVVGIVFGSVTRLLAPQLLSLYITQAPDAAAGTTEAIIDLGKAITNGQLRMNFVCLPYFLCGIMDVTTGALRGMGASTTPMIISVLGVCGIRIGWIYTFFKLYPTMSCLFFSYPVSWLLTFICELIAYIIIFNQKKKKAEKLGLVV